MGEFVNFWKSSYNCNMTTSTQILRVCSKRMVSATCTRNLTVVTSPLLFRNDTMKYSAVTGTGMSVTRTENWFKRKYNDIKNSYLQVANRLSEQDVNAAAAMLSSYCIGGVDSKEFFEFFDLPDTFRSWFIVSELHIYMICNRLLVGQLHDAQRVKTVLVKALWEDVLERIKLLADIPAKKRKENLMDLNFEFQA